MRLRLPCSVATAILLLLEGSSLAAPAPAPAPAAPTAIVVEPATPLPAPAPSVTSAVVISLGISGDVERKTITYGCEGQPASLSVDFINAPPNYLALVPIDGSVLVFNTVLAASGAKYAAGKYVFWTKGGSASLYDLTQGDSAKPILTCATVNETP